MNKQSKFASWQQLLADAQSSIPKVDKKIVPVVQGSVAEVISDPEIVDIVSEEVVPVVSETPKLELKKIIKTKK